MAVKGLSQRKLTEMPSFFVGGRRFVLRDYADALDRMYAGYLREHGEKRF